MASEQVEPEVQSEKLLTIDKLKTLPRVSEELFRCKTWYDRIKRNHRKIGIFLLIIEWILTQSASFVKTLSTKEDYSFLNRRSKKVRIIDQFFCHQLEFIEQHLRQVDTAYIYQPGGTIERGYLMLCLILRVVFILPRLAYAMMIAVVDVTGSEIMEDLDLGMKIVKPAEVRRSERIVNKSKISRSPGKKCKHEETENHKPLPEYFYVHEYSQESDPDFVPDSDGDDTEITSASEHSHDDSSENEETEEPNRNDEQIKVSLSTVNEKKSEMIAPENPVQPTPA